jgi:hypothetical protein
MYQMPDDRPQQQQREVQARVLLDRQGNEWSVREVETPQAWAHAGRCLIFSSPAVVRRVWSYPREWARLSSRELLDLVESPPAR